VVETCSVHAEYNKSMYPYMHMLVISHKKSSVHGHESFQNGYNYFNRFNVVSPVCCLIFWILSLRSKLQTLEAYKPCNFKPI